MSVAPRALRLVSDDGVSPRGSDEFERVYDELHDSVRRTVRALGVSDDAIDDVTQDVFLVVHRRLPDFDHRAPVRAWVFGIARNLARKHRERLGRARTRLQVVHGGPPEAPDETVSRRQAAQIVERFLDSLDDDKRAVFVLCEVDGLSAPEVAHALGVKLNTVYSRLRAARQRFARVVARAEAQRRRARARRSEGSAVDG